MLTSKELRSAYLNFFESKGHLVHPSDSLLPEDPSLLYTSAGMVQFKAYFMGEKTPPKTRIVTSQKCMRTDDIEEVGDCVHHTFFEMLGNFSFGDYFKREAITWAWEFLTEIIKINPENLWTSIYKDDEEAFEIWTKEVGFPENRIVRLGANKNYWPANAPEEGPNGVCGPCNEIFLDVTPEAGIPKDPAWSIAYDSNRFVEIWNLVFTQFERKDGGILEPLPFRNIDTGMGLDRTLAAINGFKSNYDSDLFMPIIKQIEILTGKKYSDDNEDTVKCFRVIADHIRSAVFAMGDGVMPSNVGRGYVLRRLIRNAVVKGRKLGLNSNFLTGIVSNVVEMMGDVYPELIDRQTYTEKIMQSEEEKFRNTLESGMERLENAIENAKSSNNIIDGNISFNLYDTYGFPLELTLEIAAEYGIKVDTKGFEEAMNEQRLRAQNSGMFSDVMGSQTENYIKELEDSGIEKTGFCGYHNLSNDTFIVGIVKDGNLIKSASKGDEILLIVKETAFYGEMGGQIGDKGLAIGEDFKANIINTIRNSGYFLHECKVLEGNININSPVHMSVSAINRIDTERNHTATHILHSAIQSVFGEHAVQSGSFVSSEKLRFDYSHFETPTKEELEKIETIVNETILADLKVSSIDTSIEEARELGAKALFGEKYGDRVRVVDVLGCSKEFCGGTHVNHSSQIGLFKIISDASLGSGIRRIEAVTGRGVLALLNDFENKVTDIVQITNSQMGDVVNAVKRLSDSNKELDNQLNKAKEIAALGKVDDMLMRSVLVNDCRYVAAIVEIVDVDVLKKMADVAVDRMEKPGAILIVGTSNEKLIFISKANKDAVDRGINCGKLVKAAATVAGGGGGGRADFAQAGGKNPSKISDAMTAAKKLFDEMVS